MRRDGKTTPRGTFAWLVLIVAANLVFWGAEVATAQSQFSPALRVNDKAITAYELDQREALLRALGAPGNLASEARERLIEERLQGQAAEELELELSEEALRAGAEEFAQRSNIDADTFISTLAERGVAAETFLDFIEAGTLWREVVRVRFGPRAQVSEDEIDRALALAGQSGGARVLVSEIILPARNAEELAIAEARAAQIAGLSGFEAFSNAARNVSASPTAQRGGRIDWVPLSELPAPLRADLLTLPPGGITEPLRTPTALAIFQLRALQELPPERPTTVAVDYAEFRMPGASDAEVRALAGEVDTCDDLFGLATGLPEDRLLREVRSPSELPADVSGILAELDADEISTRLVRGNTRIILMLCGRTSEQAEALDRGTVRRRLVNARIASYANAYLAELRSDAEIIELQ